MCSSLEDRGTIRHIRLTASAVLELSLGCNRGVGLALIQSIDFHRRTVLLMSPVPVEKVRVLQVGDLYVGLDGHELGQVGREGP